MLIAVIAAPYRPVLEAGGGDGNAMCRGCRPCRPSPPPRLVMRPCPEIRGQLAGQTSCQQSPLGEQLFGGYETISPSAPYIVKMPELINMIWYQFAIYYQLHRQKSVDPKLESTLTGAPSSYVKESVWDRLIFSHTQETMKF